MVGGWTKTKLMLNSTQVEVKVEVGVELGNIILKILNADINGCCTLITCELGQLHLPKISFQYISLFTC